MIPHSQQKGCYAAMILLLAAVHLSQSAHTQQRSKHKSGRNREEPAHATKVDIRQHLRVFDTRRTDADFYITLCADVPLNRKPERVAYHQQTGHVFLILQQVNPETPADTIHRVFGYYPKKGLPVLLFKKIKAVIKDNSRREYDISISRKITAPQCASVIECALSEAKRRYHINKFNCYDYAVTVYNTACVTDTLDLVHVRFPFIFGKGGSPSGLYRQLRDRAERRSTVAALVRTGNYEAPASTDFGKEETMAGKADRPR